MKSDSFVEIRDKFLFFTNIPAIWVVRMLGEEAIEDDIVAAVEEVHHRVKTIRYIMVAVCLRWH